MDAMVNLEASVLIATVKFDSQLKPIPIGTSNRERDCHDHIFDRDITFYCAANSRLACQFPAHSTPRPRLVSF